jgi:hypothetical protein
MATYNIKAMYEYEGEVEANSEAEAEKLFLDELNSYYAGTYSFEIEKIAECTECGEPDIHAVEDFTCDSCADNEDEEQL